MTKGCGKVSWADQKEAGMKFVKIEKASLKKLEERSRAVDDKEEEIKGLKAIVEQLRTDLASQASREIMAVGNNDKGTGNVLSPDASQNHGQGSNFGLGTTRNILHDQHLAKVNSLTNENNFLRGQCLALSADCKNLQKILMIEKQNVADCHTTSNILKQRIFHLERANVELMLEKNEIIFKYQQLHSILKHTQEENSIAENMLAQGNLRDGVFRENAQSCSNPLDESIRHENVSLDDAMRAAKQQIFPAYEKEEKLKLAESSKAVTENAENSPSVAAKKTTPILENVIGYKSEGKITPSKSEENQFNIDIISWPTPIEASKPTKKKNHRCKKNVKKPEEKEQDSGVSSSESSK